MNITTLEYAKFLRYDLQSKNIKKLTIFIRPGETEEYYKTLIIGFPNLVDLTIIGADYIDPQILARLEYLNISNTQITTFGKFHKKYNNLKKLVAENCNIDMQHIFKCFANLEYLKIGKLEDNSRITLDIPKEIEYYKNVSKK